MTAPGSGSPNATQRLTTAVLVLVIVLSLILVAVLNPGLVRFWPMGAGEFLQTIAPVVLVSLLIERTLEVFLTTWRGPEAARLDLGARRAGADAKLAAEQSLTAYKAATQRIAFLSGIALGVVVSALGVRILGLFVDPAVFRSLSALQREWFNAADVLLTGAVLGGGADGLHKIISVFTSFLDATTAKVKATAQPTA
jgi:hypothetical protein